MSFDSIAPHYRWLETIAFGNALQKARIFFLDQIPTPRRVLIAGEGNGRFVREFVRKFPQVGIDCVDASAQMLQAARRSLQCEPANVRFLKEDLLIWSPDESAYDLIVTHFFLDCFNEREAQAIVDKLTRSAAPEAVWLLADFSVPTKLFAKLHARAWLWCMHRFFRIVSGISARRLVNPSPLLEANGFHCVNRRDSKFGLVKSELWRRPIFCSGGL